MSRYDEYDRQILGIVQEDCTISMDALGDRVNLSRNAAWRRVKVLQDAGLIRKQVAIVDAERAGCGLTALVFVRTSHHEPEWLEKFRSAVSSIANVVEAYRMSGDLDYMLKVRVADMKAYDAFYQRLIAKVPLADVSASFVMEEIKETTRVPLDRL